MTDRLDGDAVQRVLRRAHEKDGALPASDGSPGLEPSTLIEAAEEVGINPNAVRDSLAVERFVAPAPVGKPLDRVVGPEYVMVEREVRVEPLDALDVAEAWLTQVHRLVCDRRSDTMLFARRRNDTVAQVSRSFASARGEGKLAIRDLYVEVAPQLMGSAPGEPRSLLRITAGRSTARTVRLASGASIGAGGLATGGLAASAIGTMIALPVVAGPFVVGGYVVARSGRSRADRVELELERLLSRISRGERPTGLLGRVAKRARKAVGSNEASSRPGAAR